MPRANDAVPARYEVTIGWDDEAKVLRVVETEIEGLWLEADTRDALVAKIRDAAHELVAHNHGIKGPFSLELIEQLALTDA